MVWKKPFSSLHRPENRMPAGKAFFADYRVFLRPLSGEGFH
jgi:hypothetical protein